MTLNCAIIACSLREVIVDVGLLVAQQRDVGEFFSEHSLTFRICTVLLLEVENLRYVKHTIVIRYIDE